MRYMTGTAIALVTGVLAVIGVACSSDAQPVTKVEPTAVSTISLPSEPTTSGQLEPTSLPSQPDEPVMVEVLAPIQETHIRIAESFPLQYFLEVTSGLPNGCFEFDGYEVERDDATIAVTVTNLEPADKDTPCTAQLRIVTTNIALGSDFEPGSEYTIEVNDVTLPFTAGEARNTSKPSDQSGSTDLGSPFKIGAGDGVAITSAALEVTFVEVVEDSRCAKSVVCIWAGQARIKVQILNSRTGEDLGQQELTLAGGQEPASVTFGRYTVEFLALDPYPETPTQDTMPDYTATVIVRVASAGNITDDSQVTLDDFSVSLSGEPVENRPLTMLFMADITGGPDNSRELYCQGTVWEFGDGESVAVMPGCLVWTPEAKFNRHYEQTYAYERPGTYRVTFTNGPLPPETIRVEVR